MTAKNRQDQKSVHLVLKTDFVVFKDFRQVHVCAEWHRGYAFVSRNSRISGMKGFEGKAAFPEFWISWNSRTPRTAVRRGFRSRICTSRGSGRLSDALRLTLTHFSRFFSHFRTHFSLFFTLTHNFLEVWGRLHSPKECSWERKCREKSKKVGRK